jgi:hypothetical protein
MIAEVLERGGSELDVLDAYPDLRMHHIDAARRAWIGAPSVGLALVRTYAPIRKVVHAVYQPELERWTVWLGCGHLAIRPGNDMNWRGWHRSKTGKLPARTWCEACLTARSKRHAEQTLPRQDAPPT